MKFLEIILKTFFNIVTIFIILLVILIGYNFFQISILNKKYSNFFDYTFFEVTTGSMSGTIEINDVVIVKINDNIKENDIITYELDDTIITHRLIKIEDNQLITKGDANNAEDRPIEKTSVIGKVIKVIPKLGIWIKVLSDVKVIASIIVTIILFGLAVSTDKKEKQKEETSFSRFMKNRRKKRNGESKEKKKS